jgi:hypothetical protein
MKEHDPLNSVLREWEAPEPSSAVDARVRAAYLLLAPVLWLQFRSRPPAPQPATVTPAGAGYMTRIETAGFKPLPDGATRVIRSGGWKQ